MDDAMAVITTITTKAATSSKLLSDVEWVEWVDTLVNVFDLDTLMTKDKQNADSNVNELLHDILRTLSSNICSPLLSYNSFLLGTTPQKMKLD
eukprot:scaffold1010_cov112-Skeletonema_marinoi.AAC.3